MNLENQDTLPQNRQNNLLELIREFGKVYEYKVMYRN